MWIDTHCHLDAGEFDPDREQVADAAEAAGVRGIVVPAVAAWKFDTVRALAHRDARCVYALGIHPLCSPGAGQAELDTLRRQVAASMDDPRFVGIGEIGLDYFVPGLDDARQQHFYDAQLRLAREFDLPAICHVRKSQDQVLKGLRRNGVKSGIAHAFNGSFQQARAFIDHGLHLGFGGNVTFERALQIRRLAQQLPLEAIVVETDAPDIPPHWLYTPAAGRAAGQPQGRNSPAELPRIAAVVAQLRGVPVPEWAATTTANAHAALHRL